MPSTVMTGQAAQVRWAYRLAASVRNWELRIEGRAATVTATVVTSDVYAVTQQPLTFVVPREKGPAWSWPIESLQIDGAALSARLLLPEE